MRLTKTELRSARPYEEGMIDEPEKYTAKSVPAAGAAAKLDIDQITFE